MADTEKPTVQLAYICQGCQAIYWAPDVSCDCQTPALMQFEEVQVIRSETKGKQNVQTLHTLLQELCRSAYMDGLTAIKREDSNTAALQKRIESVLQTLGVDPHSPLVVELASHAATWDGEIRPQDMHIETIAVRLGGFAGVIDSGIRITHLPTGEQVTETKERSAHRNRQKAFDRLVEVLTAKRPSSRA